MRRSLRMKVLKKKWKYEKKCEVYGLIWNALSDIHNATIKLRGMTSSKDAEEENNDRKKLFITSYNQFQITVIKNRPFIEDNFYKICKEMIDVFKGDFVEFHKSMAKQKVGAVDPFTEWINAEKRLDNIDDKIEEIIKYIKGAVDKMC